MVGFVATAITSPSLPDRIKDALLELRGVGDPFSGEIETLEDIHHRGQNLCARKLRARGKLGVLADLVEIIDLLAIEGRDDAVRVRIREGVMSFHHRCRGAPENRTDAR